MALTKKDKFINFIQTEIFNNPTMPSKRNPEDWADIISYWEKFKAPSDKKVSDNKMTENGYKLLSWMQENREKYDNIFTSQIISEGLFISKRSVSGTMRKLINDDYVTRISKEPVVQYSLTDNGIEYQLEE